MTRQNHPAPALVPSPGCAARVAAAACSALLAAFPGGAAANPPGNNDVSGTINQNWNFNNFGGQGTVGADSTQATVFGSGQYRIAGKDTETLSEVTGGTVSVMGSVSSGSDGGEIFGAYGKTATNPLTARNNRVEVSASVIATESRAVQLIGASADGGSQVTLAANTVAIRQGGSYVGVSNQGSIIGAESLNAASDVTAKDNRVLIAPAAAVSNTDEMIGAQILKLAGSSVSAFTAANNGVEIRDGAVVSSSRIFGTNVEVSIESTQSIAQNSFVKVEQNATLSDVCIYGAKNETSFGINLITGSIVTLGSGSYKTVVAGLAFSDAGAATVQDSTVTIHGTADLSGAVVMGGLALKGEHADYAADDLLGAMESQNTEQTVNLVKQIREGSYAGASWSDSTGNKLVFGDSATQSAWVPASRSILLVGGFNEIRFDQAVWGKTIAIQNFMGPGDGSGQTLVNASKVAFSGVDALAKGDSYKMLTLGTVHSGSIALSSTESTYTLGTTLQGTGTVSLSEDGKTVTYTVASVDGGGSGGGDTPALTPQEQTHNAAMTASAGTTALTQGADTTSVATNNLAGSGIQGAQGFSSAAGGFGRTKTGSHVNLNSVNFSVGLGTNIRSGAGLLSVGGAFEAGWGRFKNHFDAGDADPYIKKKGDVRYYGLALVSNYAWDSMWHANAALRFGRMKSKQSNALYNAANQQTYDASISSWYAGLELGAGKVIPLSEKNSIDLYGKYFFLYQDDDKFNAGGVYEIDSVKSHRLRLAGRFMHQASERTSFYAGLGVEHEFDGKAKLKVDGFEAKPAKMKGTRGYGEIGVTVKPAAATGWQFDFSLNGLAGSRYRGAWAKAEAKYMF